MNLTCFKNLAHFCLKMIFPVNSDSFPVALPEKGQPLPALPLNLIPFEVTVPLMNPSAKALSGHTT